MLWKRNSCKHLFKKKQRLDRINELRPGRKRSLPFSKMELIVEFLGRWRWCDGDGTGKVMWWWCDEMVMWCDGDVMRRWWWWEGDGIFGQVMWWWWNFWAGDGDLMVMEFLGRWWWCDGDELIYACDQHVLRRTQHVSITLFPLPINVQR